MRWNQSFVNSCEMIDFKKKKNEREKFEQINYETKIFLEYKFRNYIYSGN